MTNKIQSYLLSLFILMSVSVQSYASERAELGWEKIEDGFLLFDVRTQGEYDQGHLENSLLQPLQEIEAWSQSLTKDTPIVLYCRSGNRSGIAYDHLKAKGFTHLHNAGGYQEMLNSK